ncbi:hypothetical protein FQN51_007849 [Onygenales sp. PD_10]|nr:hypothetical protein FQN51_007849 [Onygenales sp. PD_10]
MSVNALSNAQAAEGAPQLSSAEAPPRKPRRFEIKGVGTPTQRYRRELSSGSLCQTESRGVRIHGRGGSRRSQHGAGTQELVYTQLCESDALEKTTFQDQRLRVLQSRGGWETMKSKTPPNPELHESHLEPAPTSKDSPAAPIAPRPAVFLPAAMMSQSLRASRSLLARTARQPLTAARRTFIASPIRQADLVQDLYLRELRAYKPAPTKASDADAYVQKFSVPKPPPSPEESNIAADLKAYETQEVEVEGQSASGEPTPVEEDWFEEAPEEEAAAH